MKREIIVPKLYKWLGTDGRKFFQQVKDEFGSVAEVIPPEHELNESPFPYAVHFNEGMQVRNFIRQEFKDEKFDSIELDNEWPGLVEEALRYEPKPKKMEAKPNRLDGVE